MTLQSRPMRRLPAREATQCSYTPKPRAVAVPDGKARMVVPLPKANPLRDESYRRWVASLPCAHCGVEGFSQAAHGDQGKGMGIKAGDDTCYPACGPHPVGRNARLYPGCHWQIGTSGVYSKAHRRELEGQYAAQTRALASLASM